MYSSLKKSINNNNAQDNQAEQSTRLDKIKPKHCQITVLLI